MRGGKLSWSAPSGGNNPSIQSYLHHFILQIGNLYKNDKNVLFLENAPKAMKGDAFGQPFRDGGLLVSAPDKRSPSYVHPHTCSPHAAAVIGNPTQEAR